MERKIVFLTSENLKHVFIGFGFFFFLIFSYSYNISHGLYIDELYH